MREPLSNVSRAIKPWNIFAVGRFLFDVKIKFSVEEYLFNGDTRLLFPSIHPHHLEAVDFRNKD